MILNINVLSKNFSTQVEKFTSSDHPIFGFEEIGSLVASYLEKTDLRKVWHYKEGWDLKEQFKEKKSITYYDLIEIQNNHSIQRIQSAFELCYNLCSLEISFSNANSKNLFSKIAIPSLNSLTFFNSQLHETSLFANMEIRFPALSSITCLRCTAITNRVITEFQACSTLSSMSFNTCDIQSNEVKQILRKTQHLSNLLFESCQKITSSGLQIDVDLSNLKSIGFHNCRSMTNGGMVLLSPHVKQLSSASFAFSSWLTNSGLIPFIEECTNITFLNLSNCIYMNGDSVTAIATHLPHLTSINLSHTKGIDLNSFQALIKQCTFLVHFDLSSCRWMRNSYLNTLVEDRSEVVTLDLTDCTYLRNEEVEKIMQHCRNVKLSLPYPPLASFSLT